MHVHPVKQHFNVLNHLKATDGLKNLAPGACDHRGKHLISPLVFLVTGQPTYHVVRQLKRCVCFCASCAYGVHEFVSKYSLMGKACQLVSEGCQREALVNRLLPLATPKLPQSGTLLPPIEVEFIDQPCGFKSNEFVLGLNCILVSKLLFKTCCPSLHRAILIPSLQQNR